MIMVGTRLNVADNSGAYEVSCVKVLANLKRRSGIIGDLIIVSIKRINRKKLKFKKGMLRLGVIIRTKKIYKRSYGISLKFDENAVIMVNRKRAPFSKRFKGPIPFEVCLKYKYIATVAKSII